MAFLPLQPESLLAHEQRLGRWTRPMLKVAKENHTASSPPLRGLNVGQELKQLMRTMAMKQHLQSVFDKD